MSTRAFAGKRILMILENSRYPVDPRVRRESRALVEAGYGVSVICPQGRKQPWHEILKGVSVYRYPAPALTGGVVGYLWEYGYALVASLVLSWVVLFREGFDVIHACNPPDILVLIALLYKPFGKRFVYDHHDLAPEMYDAIFEDRSNRFVRGLLVWFEKLSCRVADQVIATNESYKTMEMERDHVPADRITVVRNGPDLERLQVVEPDPDLRKKAKVIIGYLGIMGPQDRVDYLIRALYHLMNDLHRTDFFCVLVGFGDSRKSLEQLAKQLGLESHVWFTGMIPDETLVRYLSATDICVDPDPANPFTTRSTMLKLMEYMAFGKPTVAFDLVEHHASADGAALYVLKNDPLDMARAIAQLMDDPARRQAMGATGRQRIETDLAWNYSVPSLLSVYDRVFSTEGTSHTELPAAPDLHKSTGIRLVDWKQWLSLRDVRYIAKRLLSILERYGFTSAKAKKRTIECVEFLAQYDCQPTFAVPGRVIQKNIEFFRELQARRVELAVHGFDHVDFHSLDSRRARDQFSRASETFSEHGISFEGFRCPYLSWTDDLTRAIPPDLFQYSSNKAIEWNIVPDKSLRHASSLFRHLEGFYSPESSTTRVATPRLERNWLEIPPSLPDDLQLYDGLQLGAEGVSAAWSRVMHDIHARGELFVVLFHVETFHQCALAMQRILTEAKSLQPAMWITRLQDVSRWWRIKSNFGVTTTRDSDGLCIDLRCDPRATVLLHHLEPRELSHAWDNQYRVLEGRTLVTHGPRPFVGVTPAIPARTVVFLKEQGFIVDTTDQASECSIYLDDPGIQDWTEVELVKHLESSPAPYIRFSRWPDEAKSAICITGDLDALSLADYASRLYSR